MRHDASQTEHAIVLFDLFSDCTCENVACGRCICLHLQETFFAVFFGEVFFGSVVLHAATPCLKGAKARTTSRPLHGDRIGRHLLLNGGHWCFISAGAKPGQTQRVRRTRNRFSQKARTIAESGLHDAVCIIKSVT